jgi:hypothetical protein
VHKYILQDETVSTNMTEQSMKEAVHFDDSLYPLILWVGRAWPSSMRGLLANEPNARIFFY